MVITTTRKEIEMTNQELAKIVCDAVNEAAKKIGTDAFDVNIFLQDDMPNLYGVHCDLSYGGTKEAEEAVRDELPNELFNLDDPDGFEDALAEAWGDYEWAC